MTILQVPELIRPRHCCCTSTPLKLAAHQLPSASGHPRTFPFRRRELNMQGIAPGTNVLRLALAASRESRIRPASAAGVPVPPLDLTEDNIKQVLADARVEASFKLTRKGLSWASEAIIALSSLQLAQLFDSSVGITGVVELAEMDGPFVKISLRGRFWHERSTVLARVGNYLKQRIPEILEVDVKDEKMLDDSPENF
ncbi:hypothetical protein CDL15_Pgr003257 [Punica granatum]|uniref:NIF system FeS cluster assembly NifU C-terminal domain-containing protein n=1 Tax=Punica granatum TaxID=22663 RepID=A0A218X2Z6_PUNGR|nr:hypothetical protein CDL15_Pgr003257 [Punica granatum]